MFRIIEIAAGVFLGICFCGLVFGIIPEWLRRRKIEQNYQRVIQSRFKRAHERGATDIVGLYDLEKWERANLNLDPFEEARREVEQGIRTGRVS